MIRSCADKLGSGRERDTVQRTAKRYDNDRGVKDVGLRLPQLVCCYDGGKVLPTNNKQTSNDK